MGRGEEGSREVGEEGDYIYLSLHCHHQKDFCIKMGSDESHFINCERQSQYCVQTTTFEEKGAEVDSNQVPSAYQPITPYPRHKTIAPVLT